MIYLLVGWLRFFGVDVYLCMRVCVSVSTQNNDKLKRKTYMRSPYAFEL